MEYNKKIQAQDDLRKLFGYPPYDGPSNICRNDAYFASAIVRKYGKQIAELAKDCGISLPKSY